MFACLSLKYGLPPWSRTARNSPCLHLPSNSLVSIFGNVRGSALAKVHARFRCVHLLQEGCVYMCMSLCVYISVCVCPCACVYVSVCICMYMCVFGYLWMCVCVCVCAHVHKQLIVANCPCWCTGPFVALPACGPLPVHSPESSLSQSFPRVSGR